MKTAFAHNAAQIGHYSFRPNEKPPKFSDEFAVRKIVENAFLRLRLKRLERELRDINILLGYYRLYIALIEPARRRSRAVGTGTS